MTEFECPECGNKEKINDGIDSSFLLKCIDCCIEMGEID